MRDAHYTDASIARRLISACGNVVPSRVADFACGEGALLREARSVWGSSAVLGVDITDEVEQPMRRSVPHAEFLKADFLASDMLTPEVLGCFDVILLNPPFSCRGSTTLSETVAGKAVRCSKALAFVIRSLRYLARGGVLVAILPSSCLHSEKDSFARALLAKLYDFDVLPISEPVRFAGCSVSTRIVRIRRREGQAFSPHTLTANRDPRFQVVRGIRPNDKTVGEIKLLPFVHTTELNGNSVTLGRAVSPSPADRLIHGPAVLLPRVGRPKKDKISLLSAERSVRISDCVLAITHPDQAAVSSLFEVMLSDWDNVCKLYRGTCAAYTTLARLRSYLSTLDICSERLSAAA